MSHEVIEGKAVRILQELVRINTANEEAEEYQAAIYIQELLKDYPIQTEIVYSPEGRANLIASIKSDHPEKEQLVLLSHLDVVSPGEKEWTYPPFSGKEADGCIWGRGTLDTKQLTVMHLIALLEVSEKRAQLNRDIYLVSTADEENGSKEGMEFLAKERPELFEGAIVLSEGDRKSTRLNSSHVASSYAVFCLTTKQSPRTGTHMARASCGMSGASRVAATGRAS